jgi:hypothetical protein
MGTVNVHGVGHPGDPFQVIVTLTAKDVDAARAPESIVLDNPDAGYDADPQIRTSSSKFSTATEPLPTTAFEEAPRMASFLHDMRRGGNGPHGSHRRNEMGRYRGCARRRQCCRAFVCLVPCVVMLVVLSTIASVRFE